MTDVEIENTYKLIVENHKKYLVPKGVVLPKLKINNIYTKDALVLTRLAKGYPNTEIISKQILTSFVKSYFSNITDVQQARHLSMQKGWNILSSTRGDILSENFPKNSYKLVDLTSPYPAFTKERREGFHVDFECLKKEYNYHCATCGSQEDQEHLFRKGVIIKLQKGHIDPNKPLQIGNIFPQCQICNRGDRNRWVYDKTGRVIEVAETQDGLRIIKAFIKKASGKVKNDIFTFLKGILRK